MVDCFVLAGLLTAALGHDDFRTREAASAALARLGCLAEANLEAAARSPDAEVGGRARRLLATLRTERLDRIPVADLPWIDALPDDHPGREEAITGYLAWTTYSAADDWLGYKQATAHWLRDELAAGRSWGELAEVLERMRARQACWRKHKSYREPELLPPPREGP